MTKQYHVSDGSWLDQILSQHPGATAEEITVRREVARPRTWTVGLQLRLPDGTWRNHKAKGDTLDQAYENLVILFDVGSLPF